MRRATCTHRNTSSMTSHKTYTLATRKQLAAARTMGLSLMGNHSNGRLHHHHYCRHRRRRLLYHSNNNTRARALAKHFCCPHAIAKCSTRTPVHCCCARLVTLTCNDLHLLGLQGKRRCLTVPTRRGPATDSTATDSDADRFVTCCALQLCVQSFAFCMIPLHKSPAPTTDK
jgi:hypothetical protein